MARPVHDARENKIFHFPAAVRERYNILPVIYREERFRSSRRCFQNTKALKASYNKYGTSRLKEATHVSASFKVSKSSEGRDSGIIESIFLTVSFYAIDAFRFLRSFKHLVSSLRRANDRIFGSTRLQEALPYLF